MSARHVGSKARGPRCFAERCPLCEGRRAKKKGRLRIEQRARERRAMIAEFTHQRRWGPRIARQWARLRTYGGIVADRRMHGRLSKHQRGRTARRNRRNGGEG